MPKNKPRVKLFSNDKEAVFLSRPNRFIMLAEDGDAVLTCHCPNPGRLIEFLFPGETLILEKQRSETAKTGWTAVGIYYRQGIVPLCPSRANTAAETLILPTVIPGLSDVRREYTIGSSRFDFLAVDRSGNNHLIEVKACSLVEYGAAMFPDAPSVRALRHLEELADLADKGYCCHILFVIVHGNPERFIPALHTDPRFALGLRRYAEKVQLHASLIRCAPDGTAVLANPDVPVDIRHAALAAEDRGNYLILMEIAEAQDLAVGALGIITILPGWYVYAGSAQKNLSHRTARHLRKIRKRRHWHIDYLTACTKTMSALPILSYRNLECALARGLADLGGRPIPGFGCSDCRCGSHLFYFPDPPMANRGFVAMLLRYRHRESLQQ
ncbi:MAG: DNA/RNA nuclease SfsA [Spirochaetaceae bacterium]|jgi:sugar fermentation stimulation protein A|nr:DNA/RNA nuclease SfsA [Spirochaetaceae bacterium]